MSPEREAEVLWDRLQRCGEALATREKRMREVAEEMDKASDEESVHIRAVLRWRAKLLEGIEKEDAGT